MLTPPHVFAPPAAPLIATGPTRPTAPSWVGYRATLLLCALSTVTLALAAAVAVITAGRHGSRTGARAQ